MKKRILFILAAIFLAGANAHAENFTDNGNGTVTDGSTTLIWQKEDDNTFRTWEEAIAYCESLTLAGQPDWRLPNVKELKSIVDNTKYNPTIDAAYFPNTDSSFYWSSTTLAINASIAWHVYFGNGYVSYYGKSNNDYARCVRGGQ